MHGINLDESLPLSLKFACGAARLLSAVHAFDVSLMGSTNSHEEYANRVAIQAE
jgi:hypothetical protein